MITKMTEQNFKALYARNLEKMETLTGKQRKILAAALELFSTQGFEATSSAQIAQKAGVAAGTVYHHFHNKRELLLAVMTPLFAPGVQTVADEFVNTAFEREFATLEDFITTVVADRMTFIHDNIQELQLMMGQLLTDKNFAALVKATIGAQLAAVVIPTVKRLKAEKKIVELPNDMILQFMLGTTVAYFGKLVLGIQTMGLNKEIRYITQLLVRALKP